MLQAVNVYSVSDVNDVRAKGEVSGILVCQALNKLPGLYVIGHIHVCWCYQPIGEHELCCKTLFCVYVDNEQLGG